MCIILFCVVKFMCLKYFNIRGRPLNISGMEGGALSNFCIGEVDTNGY